MTDFVDFITSAVRGFDLRSFVDILIVGSIAYWLLSLIQGTELLSSLKGRSWWPT